MKIPYKFNKESFDETAKRTKEPEKSLEELLKNYEKAAQQYRDFRQRMNEMEERYCRKRVNAQGHEETYIDYDAWEKEDPDSFLALSCAEFNALNAIDIMKDMIDTKIYYMNLREEE